MLMYCIYFKTFISKRCFFIVADDYRYYFSRSRNLEFYDFFNNGVFVGRVELSDVERIVPRYTPI